MEGKVEKCKENNHIQIKESCSKEMHLTVFPGV